MSERLLNNEQAYILRELARKTYLSIDELADVFSVSASTIYSYTVGVKRPAKHCVGSKKRAELSKKYAHARRLLEIGYTVRIIARETNLSSSTICKLKQEMKLAQDTTGL